MFAANKKITVAAFLILLLGMLVLGARLFAPFFVPLLLGALFAALVRPWKARLRAKGLSAGLASGLTVLALVVCVLAPIGFFAYQAADQGIALFSSLDAHSLPSLKVLSEKAHTVVQTLPFGDRLPSPLMLEQQAQNLLKTFAAAVTAALLDLFRGIPSFILQSVLSLFACFFLLRDGHRLRAWIADKVPLDPEVQRKLAMSWRESSISVLLATVVASGTQALMLFVGYLVLGVPGAFLAGGATFFFSWIPLVGSTPVWLTGAAILYGQGAIAKMIAMLIIGALTGVADNLVRPLVLKGKSDMHPMLGLVAIFGGVQMFGFLGVFFGPIIIALLLAVLELWPVVGRRAGWLREVPGPATPSPTPDSL